jgi:hypothetical protein
VREAEPRRDRDGVHGGSEGRGGSLVAAYRHVRFSRGAGRSFEGRLSFASASPRKGKKVPSKHQKAATKVPYQALYEIRRFTYTQPKSRFFGYRKPVFRIFLSVGSICVRWAALLRLFLLCDLTIKARGLGVSAWVSKYGVQCALPVVVFRSNSDPFRTSSLDLAILERGTCLFYPFGRYIFPLISYFCPFGAFFKRQRTDRTCLFRPFQLPFYRITSSTKSQTGMASRPRRSRELQVAPRPRHSRDLRVASRPGCGRNLQASSRPGRLRGGVSSLRARPENRPRIATVGRPKPPNKRKDPIEVLESQVSLIYCPGLCHL